MEERCTKFDSSYFFLRLTGKVNINNENSQIYIKYNLLFEVATG